MESMMLCKLILLFVFLPPSTQFGLAQRIDTLQATLLQVRKETDDEISRLRDELLAKNRTLARLESQLREQTDYEELRRQSE